MMDEDWECEYCGTENEDGIVICDGCHKHRDTPTIGGYDPELDVG